MFSGRGVSASVASQKFVAPPAPKVQSIVSKARRAVSVPQVSQPKVSQIQSKGAVATNPFNSSGGYIDFELPQEINKLTDLQAEWNITFATTVTGDGVDMVVAPSPFFVKRVEIRYDGTEFETIDATEIFQELLWDEDQDVALNAKRWNLGDQGGLEDAFTITTSTPATYTWYLPVMKASVLNSVQPFLKGFPGLFTVRIHYATTIVASCKLAGTSTASAGYRVTLNKLQLWATETKLSPAEEASRLAQHQVGTSYNCIKRTKWQSPDIASLSNSRQFTQQLHGLKGSFSSALLVYVSPSDPTIEQMMQHPSIKDFQLRDARMGEITPIMPRAIVDNLAMEQVPQYSVNAFYHPTNSLLWSFCSGLKSVLETGKYGAHMTLTGSENLLITPDSTQSSVNIWVISYDLMTLIVPVGRGKLEFVNRTSA